MSRQRVWTWENNRAPIPLKLIPIWAKALRVRTIVFRKIFAEAEIRRVLVKYGLDKAGSDAKFKIVFKKIG